MAEVTISIRKVNGRGYVMCRLTQPRPKFKIDINLNFQGDDSFATRRMMAEFRLPPPNTVRTWNTWGS